MSLSPQIIKEQLEKFTNGDANAGIEVYNHYQYLAQSVANRLVNECNYDYDFLYQLCRIKLWKFLNSTGKDAWYRFDSLADDFMISEVRSFVRSNPEPLLKNSINYTRVFAKKMALDVPEAQLFDFRVQLELLPAFLKQILFFYYVNKCSIDLIAKTLNIKSEVVQSRITSTKEQLEKKYHSLDCKKKPEQGIQKTKISIKFIDFFPGYTLEELKEVVDKMPEKCQIIIHLLFGYNLDTYDYSKSEYFNFFKSKLVGLIKEKVEQNKQEKLKKYRGKRLTDYFPNNSLDELKIVISNIQESYKSTLRLIFGNDYEGFNNGDEEVNIIFETKIKPEILSGLIRLKEEESKRQVEKPTTKSFYYYFNGEPKDKIMDALSRIPEKYQEVCYLIFGKDLNTFNEEYSYKLANFKARIVPLIKDCIKEKDKVIISKSSHKCFLDYFPGVPVDDIKEAISRLPEHYQELIIELFGPDLTGFENDYRKLSNFRGGVLPALRKCLDDKKFRYFIPKKYKLFMDYFPGENINELRPLVEKLPIYYQTIVYSIFGYDLDAYNTCKKSFHSTFRKSIVNALYQLLENAKKEEKKKIGVLN